MKSESRSFAGSRRVRVSQPDQSTPVGLNDSTMHAPAELEESSWSAIASGSDAGLGMFAPGASPHTTASPSGFTDTLASDEPLRAWWEGPVSTPFAQTFGGAAHSARGNDGYAYGATLGGLFPHAGSTMGGPGPNLGPGTGDFSAQDPFAMWAHASFTFG
jgi:hypothetical protein